MQPQPYPTAAPKKRRTWLWVTLAVVALLCGGGTLLSIATLATADHAIKTTQTATAQRETDRKKDVTIKSCIRTVIDTVEITYQLKNSSTEVQSYTPHFQFTGDDEAVVGEAYDFVNDVKAGQTVKGKAIGTVSASGPFKCNLIGA
jgi:hypothetical protein